MGLLHVALAAAGHVAAQSVLVALCLVLCGQASALDWQYNPSNGDWCYPTISSISDPDANSIRAHWQNNQYIFYSKVIAGGETSSKKDCTSGIYNDGTVTITPADGTPTYSLPNITIFNQGGAVYFKDLHDNWQETGQHGDNLVSTLCTDFNSWIQMMRGLGYKAQVNPFWFEVYLTGNVPTSLPPGETITGSGGTPPVTGTGTTGTTTTSGGSSTTNSGGNTTTTTTQAGNVTSTNNQTNNYTYNYSTTNTTTNNTTNNNTGEGGTPTTVDLSPVTGAINSQGTSIGNKLDYLTNHVIDGNTAIAGKLDGIAGGVGELNDSLDDLNQAVTVTGGTGADPLTGFTAPTDGTSEGSGKYGSVASSMALSGSSAYTLSIALPWVDGGTRTYSVSSLPESGTPMDGFRVIVRACLSVIVGLAFIFMCVKTLRFY